MPGTLPLRPALQLLLLLLLIKEFGTGLAPLGRRTAWPPPIPPAWLQALLCERPPAEARPAEALTELVAPVRAARGVGIDMAAQ